jgi:hypothetical protein
VEGLEVGEKLGAVVDVEEGEPVGEELGEGAGIDGP